MEKFIPEDARLAVKKGIQWLDNNHPGWASRIDLNTLNMSECENCVIGQSVGDYTHSIMDLSSFEARRASVIWAMEHGFEWSGVAIDGYPYDRPTYGYKELDILWSEEVRNRLG